MHIVASGYEETLIFVSDTAFAALILQSVEFLLSSYGIYTIQSSVTNQNSTGDGLGDLLVFIGQLVLFALYFSAVFNIFNIS